MESISLLGSTMGLGFVSGLNLYAAVLTVGLGIRLGFIQLHPEMTHLNVLTNPYVLIAAGLLYLIEFFADKIPWVDSVWDTFHTLIRPIGAAAIGGAAVGSVDPSTRAMIVLLCGGVALSGHSAKAGTRLAVNHSPEPFSNMALSMIEDLLSVVGAWLAVAHPIVMLVAVGVFLAVFVWLSPKIFRLMRVEFIAVLSLFKRLLPAKRHDAVSMTNGPSSDASICEGQGVKRSRSTIVEKIPQKYVDYCQNSEDVVFCVRCVAGKGVKGLRNSIGYLQLTNQALTLITRKLFRFRTQPFDLNSIEDVRFKKGFLLDRIVWRIGKKQHTLLFFKHKLNYGQTVFDLLEERRTTKKRSGL